MDYEKQIKEETGLKSIAEFARYLGAPVRTIYAWIHERRGKKSPSLWTWRIPAYIDAVKYRALSVAGWKCRQCGAVIEAGGTDGRKPPSCGGCGGKYFNPVKIIEEPNEKDPSNVKPDPRGD